MSENKTTRAKAEITTAYDHPWKDAIEELFPHMMRLLQPRLYKRIDWDKPVNFMNKELRQVTKQKATQGRRFVDKLVRVQLKGGGEELLYIHIEIQNDRDLDFPKRMFVYSYRLFEKYGENIACLALLGDLSPDWKPNTYSYGVLGCRTTFKFPMIKLMDYEKKWHQLERSRNPFATVIMAHLKTKRTKGDYEARAKWKLEFFRLTVVRKIPRAEIEALLKFIDWIMELPETLDNQVDMELEQSVGGNDMAYVNRWELKGEKKGEKTGEKRGAKQGVQQMLGRQLKAKFGALPQWALEKMNTAETHKLETWGEAILLKNSLEDVLSS